MKIYIYVDMEGISGIDAIDAIMDPESEAHARGIERLMLDTNAAVDGCFAAGADEVWVWDGHGSGANFPEGALDPRAKKLPLSNIQAEMMPEIDAFMIVGAHAMAGTKAAFLDHTQSSKCWFEYRINGVPCGEIGQYAVLSGHFDIPLVMVSGDESACAEARRFIGDLALAPVKVAYERNTCVCYDGDLALARIRQAAFDGCGKIGKIKPYKTHFPYEITCEYTRADYADAVCGHPGVERLDARTVRKFVDKVQCLHSLNP